MPTSVLPFGAWGAYVITSGNAVFLAEQACLGGARILQYREKDASKKHILATARRIREITAAYNTVFIVNDFLDIAILSDADGVHLGQEDIPISEARKLVPDGFVIGVSTHSLDQAKQAAHEGAHYVGVGPVYSTPTKPDYLPIGMDTVRSVAKTVNIPLVAIGAITIETVPKLKEFGINNVAMLRGFAKDTTPMVRRMNEILLK
ncbi:MAG: thiamine phosphate synthase [Pseudomonadota bacterium]